MRAWNGAWAVAASLLACGDIGMPQPEREPTSSLPPLPPSGPVTVQIVPDTVIVAAGGPPYQLRAVVSGARDCTVAWTLPNASAAASVDSNGVFTSPVEGVYDVRATSRADPSVTAVARVSVMSDMVDHGGSVAPKVRVFLLWWGDASVFPRDSPAGLAQFFQGIDGSPYLAVLDQYLRGDRARTVFGGSLYLQEPIAADPTPAEVSDAACRGLARGGVAPVWGDMVFVYACQTTGETDPHTTELLTPLRRG